MARVIQCGVRSAECASTKSHKLGGKTGRRTGMRLITVGHGDPPTLKLRRGKHGDRGTRSNIGMGVWEYGSEGVWGESDNKPSDAAREQGSVGAWEKNLKLEAR